MEYQANPTLAKKLTRISYVVSGLVLGLVVLMRKVKLDVGVDLTFLPAVNAALNVIVAVCLLVALYAIMHKNIQKHRFFMFTAAVLSTLFLLCYIAYHFTTPETTYCVEGNIRYIYFFFLITHVILAALSFPFILLTFIRGLTFQIREHRNMAKWVFPVWLYVAVTGPVCFIMLQPCYQ